ncbi:MAG: thioesterase family protein [Bacteroidales bacterium]|nr:thioesterase family protein [Bacteroidales bacterium]
MKETIPAKYLFSVPIQIKMCDLDPFAHVNNGVQCNYFDYGRSQYFEKVFHQPVDWKTMDLVLVHIDLDFKSPIKIHDHIICETSIYEFGVKSLKMVQQLRDRQSGTVKTVCHSVLAGFDRETEQAIPIREEYKERITDFEQQNR